MRRFFLLIAAVAALSWAVAPDLAFARAGSSSFSAGSSMGSRGSRTYSAPAPTTTAPSSAMPMQRSLTPAAGAPGYGAPRSGLLGGMMGGLLGGLLLGGLFHGGFGFGGLFGLLIRIALVVLVVRFLFRWFARRAQPAVSGANLFAPGRPGPMPGGGAAQPPLAVQPADFAAFEQLLQAVQAAWSNHDLTTLRGITTPEMASYFAEQLADQVSRGVRNVVSQVKLEQGDLSEAWAEGGREYATVAMRFSMTDVTVDATGRVVDGDPAEHVQATEIWTFLRAPGGRWVLSAIQQTR
jgi:predicted lipid-binding transport protein (Tim44 family)